MNFRFVFIAFLWFTACQHTPKESAVKPASEDIRYARHFEVIPKKDYKILKVTGAYPGASSLTYVLSRKKISLPDSLNRFPVINIPVNNLIVTSTTHLPALEMLDEVDKLIAFPNTRYVSSPVVRKKIESGEVKEAGQGMQLDTETVLALHPGVVVAFSSGGDRDNYRVLEENHIPVLYNADWTETTPLGRAEWIKVFGLLLGKEQMADSIFNEIEKKYLSLKNRLKPDSLHQPVVFQGGFFGDKWFVPGGESYAAALIKDAGGRYLWQKDSHAGSINVNYENVLLKLPEADIWLNPGMYNNKEELAKDFSYVRDLQLYKNDQIYTYNLKKGATGGVLYFEQSNAHPDWVLEDLYHIFYPQTVPEFKFHFYQKLP